MNSLFSNPVEWILGFILILSSLVVILVRKPVHACLSFLVTLLTLAVLYIQLSAEFIGVMQILVYAGAILVLFMFVIVLFQDAYVEIEKTPSKSLPALLGIAAITFFLTLGWLGSQLIHLPKPLGKLPDNYGTVESIGKILYLDFFFPFEAVILIFLVAIVGALYIAKKEIKS